ncbi:MAG: M23 family metallopeptidase [Cyclobacteriaceae bacterium]|jgi:murein DD-endopeptidase MepM/ murein hydrolase activator NlpD|nr:M23 family metallopeptidase [Cyclobacteriaceae bacterium]
MSTSKFNYNPKTLRYERVKISVFNVLITAIGYLTFGVIFFIGLVLLQNLIIETPSEKKLRAENKALDRHKILLTAQLTESNRQLSELKTKDVALYQKLFETNISEETTPVYPEREELLLAGSGDFDESVDQLSQRFSELINSAKKSSYSFQSKTHLEKKDLNYLTNIPSITPVENFEMNKLVSGYGIRINPFHKGNYHHDGVDIASARGTVVRTTAEGQVSIVKRSDLVAGYGNYIEVDHGDGYITRYSHLEEIVVRQGQTVKKGQSIGIVGSSGGSIAPHLHYEVIKEGVNLNPINFFMEGIASDQYEVLVNISKKQNQSLD